VVAYLANLSCSSHIIKMKLMSYIFLVFKFVNLCVNLLFPCIMLEDLLTVKLYN